MPGKIEARLTELGIELPETQPPWADYVSYVVSNDFVYISGQLPKLGDEEYLGKLGADLTVEQGRRASRISAINMLPHLREACGGDLDRVVKCVEIGGEEIGRHTRFAVGVASLPFNYAVEVKAIFQIR